jgi:Alpha/beta hydrolase family
MGGQAGSDLFRRLSLRWVPNAKQWRQQPIEVEKKGNYYLAVIEFDDQGWFQDRCQRDVLEQFLDQKANQDLLIVVFIHGWKHNAQPHDTNLNQFCEVLNAVCRSEGHRRNREVLGVYLSWRGLSLSGNDFWMNASFWTRKKAATKVALGCVREILARLRAFQTLRNQSNDVEGPDVGTRLIFVGHSFGGLILFTAVSEYLIESVILCICKSEKHIVRPFGDLVILINPAFEAARYLPLYSAVRRAKYPVNQRPCFLAVTSTNDNATKLWFPLGRWFSTRLESVRRNALPWDDDGEIPADAQESAILHTMGHLPWLITHRLSCTKTDDSAPYKGTGPDLWPQRATGLQEI